MDWRCSRCGCGTGRATAMAGGLRACWAMPSCSWRWFMPRCCGAPGVAFWLVSARGARTVQLRSIQYRRGVSDCVGHDVLVSLLLAMYRLFPRGRASPPGPSTCWRCAIASVPAGLGFVLGASASYAAVVCACWCAGWQTACPAWHRWRAAVRQYICGWRGSWARAPVGGLCAQAQAAPPWRAFAQGATGAST